MVNRLSDWELQELDSQLFRMQKSSASRFADKQWVHAIIFHVTTTTMDPTIIEQKPINLFGKRRPHIYIKL